MPFAGLAHLEATAIPDMLAGKPVKILAVYLSPSRPLAGADLTICFSRVLPALLAGDLNAKHMDWNSGLSTRRGKPLRDYADEHSCLILVSETSTINLYNPSATLDVLDIMITKKLSSLVHLTLFSALSSDHLLVIIYIIDTACRSAFQYPPDRPDLPTSRPTRNQKFHPTRKCMTGWQWRCALRTSLAPFWRL